MKKVIIGMILIAVLGLGAFLLFRNNSNGGMISPSPSATANGAPTVSPSAMPTEPNLSIALVSIGGEVEGKAIGCDDTLVMIERPSAGGGLEEALGTLLNLNTEITEDGNELYNALGQSDLIIDRVEQSADTVDVYLEGELLLGGVCDNPRFEEQLSQTVVANSPVDTVNIYINGETLDEAMSLR